MKKKKFEIVLVNDERKMVAEPACVERDECWFDLGYCENIDTCGLDYAPGPPSS
jgi:hypothetical protein